MRPLADAFMQRCEQQSRVDRERGLRIVASELEREFGPITIPPAEKQS